MKVIVLTNPAAGAKADKADELSAVLRGAGVDSEVRQFPGNRLTAAAREATSQPIDALVAAGGDGTVSAVAAALAGSQMPLGILPTGTLNHFARDLQIPPDLRAAAAVIAAQNTRQIDLADVNGR